MPWEKKPGKTPLTESQARTLAHWWGGAYREGTIPGENDLPILHGVKLPRPSPGLAAPPSMEGDTFWSQEEAQEWENRRSSINPDAEAWVG